MNIYIQLFIHTFEIHREIKIIITKGIGNIITNRINLT